MERVQRIRKIVDAEGEISIYHIMAIENIGYSYARQIVDFIVNAYPLDYGYKNVYLFKRKPVKVEEGEEKVEGDSSPPG